MSRELHIAAVGFAGAKIAEIQESILAAREVLNGEGLPMVVNAVGEDPYTEPGRNALSFTRELSDDLEAAVRTCELIKAELVRYGGGF